MEQRNKAEAEVEEIRESEDKTGGEMFNKKLRQRITDSRKEIKELRKTKLDLYRTVEGKVAEGQKVLVEKNAKLEAENTELTQNFNSIKAKVREQTEADLFFTSAKICFELLKGKKEADLRPDLERRMQLEMMAKQQVVPCYGGGLGKLMGF